MDFRFLDLIVRACVKREEKDYKIPISVINIHIITLDFYYVNVYFLRAPIYDLIFWWTRPENNAKTEDEKNKGGKEFNKRSKRCKNFASYFNPVFQLNINRIISDLFYSENNI